MIATFSSMGFRFSHLAYGKRDLRTCGLFSDAGGKRH